MYSSKQLELPVPKLVTFYNGKKNEPDEIILKLSDSFPDELKAVSDVEVVVRMININSGRNEEIMQKCKPLQEYAWFVAEVRKNRKVHGLEEAVDFAVSSMPAAYLLKDFLTAHRAEVKDMCIEEYNEAETMQLFKEEYLEQGDTERVRKSITRMVKVKGLSYEEACDYLGVNPDDFRDLETV